MPNREVRGQPFFGDWQYRQTCETCGLPGLYVCCLDKMPKRVRVHCPYCYAYRWHTLSPLPEGFK